VPTMRGETNGFRVVPLILVGVFLPLLLAGCIGSGGSSGWLLVISIDQPDSHLADNGEDCLVSESSPIRPGWVVNVTNAKGNSVARGEIKGGFEALGSALGPGSYIGLMPEPGFPCSLVAVFQDLSDQDWYEIQFDPGDNQPQGINLGEDKKIRVFFYFSRQSGFNTLYDAQGKRVCQSQKSSAIVPGSQIRATPSIPPADAIDSEWDGTFRSAVSGGANRTQICTVFGGVFVSAAQSYDFVIEPVAAD
jgi:hypothetical protein